MFRNYLKTAWRNLSRHKGFTLINILGLTIGLTGCLVIGVFVWDELQYDKHVPGGENVYRVYEKWNNNNVISYGAAVPPAFTPYLQQHYPEVDTTLRILMTGDKFLMEVGEKSNYEDKGWFVEPSFFQIFPVKFLQGDPNTALTEPRAIVINKDLASRYFGNEDPMGKIISIDKDTFFVKGVMDKLPSHFHLDFGYLMPLVAAGLPQDRMQRWTWHQFYTYIKLKPGANAKNLESKFQDYVKTVIAPQSQNGLVTTPYLQPLKDVHLNSAEFVYDRAIRGNATYVKALTIIALFVLAIACFNFINLATARSFRRAKEIGVRKVVGADRSQIIFQFIGETILMSVISLIVAAIATVLLIPALNNFTGKAIEFNPITNPALGLLILAAGIIIGILAGLYPALVLSGFQPIKVLKNMKLTSSGGSHLPILRQALVVVQFALSALLIVSALIVYRQTHYLNNKDLGFNNEQVIYFQTRGGVNANLETFKSELKRSPNVVSVTSGYGLPGDQLAGDGVIIPTKDGNKEQGVTLLIGDHDYTKTLGLRIIAGRDFRRDMSTDETQAFIINETAVTTFGFGTPEQAIGKDIHWNEWAPIDTTQPVKKGKVIGVVQDFHYKSLHEKVAPTVIQIYPQEVFKVAAKLKTADMRSTISFINDTWNKFNPGYPLDYKFMDETYGKMYLNEGKLASLLWIFTVMAILVGCLGLFGLAAFAAEQRVKEIGIRKILGASVLNIMGLLSKNFIIMVLIASAIAFPIAWWAMNNWLEDFPYRVEMSWWIFAVAVVIAILIALITVSFQSIKAATTNPVNSLRTE